MNIQSDKTPRNCFCRWWKSECTKPDSGACPIELGELDANGTPIRNEKGVPVWYPKRTASGGVGARAKKKVSENARKRALNRNGVGKVI